MGIKKKRLRERARMDFLRLAKHAKDGWSVATSVDDERARISQRLFEKQRENDRMRQEIADLNRRLQEPPFPTMVSLQSFVRVLGKLPSRDLWREALYKHPIVLPALNTPDGWSAAHRRPLEYNPSYSDRVLLRFDPIKVVVPQISKSEAVVGWQIPAGVVVVDMSEGA